MHARTRTADHTATRSINSSSPLAGVNFVRRGSMPHLQQNGGSGQTARTWSPTLSPQRGSLAEEATLPDHGFKFGSGAPGPSTAAAALKNLDISSDSRRSPGESRKQLDSFEETEAEEAEKQRRAFLAATYGSDGKRARERLSFAGPGMLPQSASPATPSTALRRQSLMLWERINTAASAARLAEENNSLSSPPAMPAINSAKSLDDIGPRRGSLPLAIPNSGLGRNPSHRRNPIDTETDDCDVKAEDEEKTDSDFEEDKPESNIHQADEVCICSPCSARCSRVERQPSHSTKTPTAFVTAIRSGAALVTLNTRFASCKSSPQLTQPSSRSSASPTAAFTPSPCTRRFRRVRYRFYSVRFSGSIGRRRPVFK